MQLIEETVSPHLRELEFSFYGKAEGSIQRDSITLLQQWRREAQLRLSREMSFAVSRKDGSGLTAGAIAPLLTVFPGICAPTNLDDSQTQGKKARGGAIPASFLIILALSPSSSQVPVLPCVLPRSFLSSGFAVGAVQLPS